MDSQKVPAMVVLHCNVRTYSSTYLITFKVGPLLHRSCHCSKASFGIFWSSALVFNLMSSVVAERVPLDHFQSRERSREYCGWVMTGMFFTARNCCKTTDMWLGGLSWCRNHCPCHLSRRFLQTASRNLCKTCTLDMTSLSRRFELRCIKPSMPNNSGNF
jgi:hypothetical protein